MIDHSIVKIFTTKMSITSSRFHFEDAIFDCQNWHIECATTEIENEHISFTRTL